MPAWITAARCRLAAAVSYSRRHWRWLGCGVQHHADAVGVGHREPDQLELPGRDVRQVAGHAGEVEAGARQTLREAAATGSYAPTKTIGTVAVCLREASVGAGRGCDDDLGLALEQLGHQSRQPLGLVVAVRATRSPGSCPGHSRARQARARSPSSRGSAARASRLSTPMRRTPLAGAGAARQHRTTGSAASRASRRELTAPPSSLSTSNASSARKPPDWWRHSFS